MTIEKCYEKRGILFKASEDGEREVARAHTSDFGLYEYIDQRYGDTDEDFYGIIFTKTPFKNRWLERGFHS